MSAGFSYLGAQPTISTLRVNGVQAALNPNGFLFDSSGHALLVTGSGLVLAESAGTWMSATDSTGQLRVAAHNVLGSNHDFWAGPLEVLSGSAANASQWNYVYPALKGEIEMHRRDFGKDGYTMPSNIRFWPGSSSSPYAPILAPFVDYKVYNQVYEPQNGDYPYITSDALVYAISNDNFSAHTYSGSMPLGVELHTSIYGFSKQDSALANCVLVRYSIHNRSGRNYKDFRFSQAVNFRIGSQHNEFLGTDVPSQAVFVTNDTGEATFSNKLVSSGCMAFNHKISSTMYYNKGNDPINGEPSADSHFYNLMRGRWKTGKPLNYGSNGVDGSGSARYVYPYTSDASNGNLMWSEPSVGNVPGQRIGLLNMDSIELQNGSAVTYDFVYFFVEKDTFNIKQIGQYCLNIKRALASKNLLGLPSVDRKNRGNMTCYPNPVKAGEKLMIRTSLESPQGLRLVDAMGREVCKLDLDINDNYVILPYYLSSGVYTVEYQTLNTIHYYKLTINNQ